MKKRYFAIILAALALAFTGCSDPNVTEAVKDPEVNELYVGYGFSGVRKSFRSFSDAYTFEIKDPGVITATTYGSDAKDYPTYKTIKYTPVATGVPVYRDSLTGLEVSAGDIINLYFSSSYNLAGNSIPTRYGFVIKLRMN